MADRVSSPPHPRGSTRIACDIARYYLVSPAPAGIDPHLRDWPCQWRCLPRTRGDRPFSPPLEREEKRSPPHPRGSTAPQAAVSSVQIVSPAPAGIDPILTDHGGTERGLPRTRGDRPSGRPCRENGIQSPPHPRGSTAGPSLDLTKQAVSPAPAGIDLALFDYVNAKISLPRTRGDRPCCPLRSGHGLPSPPHPRGSTSEQFKITQHIEVSPAPAGIDPNGFLPRCGKKCLPRTRGDRP